jgi:hypothetical protein
MSQPAADHDDHLALAERLRDAPAATTALLREVMDRTERRVVRRGDRERSVRIDRLIAAGACADAALALIDLKLPNWRLRRIAYDGGDWHCALSRERELPDWLDDAVEAWHADLTLAILGALIEAQRISERPTRSSVPAVPFEADPLLIVACCDNFA